MCVPIITAHGHNNPKHIVSYMKCLLQHMSPMKKWKFHRYIFFYVFPSQLELKHGHQIPGAGHICQADTCQNGSISSCTIPPNRSPPVVFLLGLRADGDLKSLHSPVE